VAAHGTAMAGNRKEEDGVHGASHRKRERRVRETIKWTWIRKKEGMTEKRTMTQTSWWCRFSPKMAEMAEKAHRKFIGILAFLNFGVRSTLIGVADRETGHTSGISASRQIPTYIYV
jgi:hypothetical protein